jgi:hypothetical protein
MDPTIKGSEKWQSKMYYIIPNKNNPLKFKIMAKKIHPFAPEKNVKFKYLKI